MRASLSSIKQPKVVLTQDDRQTAEALNPTNRAPRCTVQTGAISKKSNTLKPVRGPDNHQSGLFSSLSKAVSIRSREQVTAAKFDTRPHTRPTIQPQRFHLSTLVLTCPENKFNKSGSLSLFATTQAAHVEDASSTREQPDEVLSKPPITISVSQIPSTSTSATASSPSVRAPRSPLARGKRRSRLK